MKKMWKEFKKEKVSLLTKTIIVFTLIFTCILFSGDEISQVNILLATLGSIAIFLEGYKYINGVILILLFMAF